MIKIINNPIEDVIRAATNLYPELDTEICFVEHLENKVGLTSFPNDKTQIPSIEISADIPFAAVIETIAHELSHVIAGKEHNHDDVFDAVDEAIYQEYIRVINSQKESL